jgi:hypothetical protein
MIRILSTSEPRRLLMFVRCGSYPLLPRPGDTFIRVRGRLAPVDPPIALACSATDEDITFRERGSYLCLQFVIFASGMLIPGLFILVMPGWRVIAEIGVSLILVGVLCVLIALTLRQRTRTVTLRIAGLELTERWRTWPFGGGERAGPATPRIQIHRVELMRSGAFAPWKGWAAILHWDSGWMALAMNKNQEHVERYAADLPHLPASQGAHLLARHSSFAGN